MPEETTSNIKLLSNEVQEIISNKPNWILRNGITLFFVIICSLMASSFFISYPDIVTGRAKLTSINAPKEVKTKTEGKLIKLNIAEGEMVKRKQILGFMESRADANEVIALSIITDSMQNLMQDGATEKTTLFFLKPFQNLGEVQQLYQNFIQSFIVFKQYLSTGYYLHKKRMLQSDIGYMQKLHANLLQQQSMQKEDVGLAKETIEANKSLKDDKVISALDFRNEQSRYIGKALTIPQIASAIITNESSQHEKQKEILQLENDIAQQKGIFSQALNTLKAQLEEWKNKYLLIAPVDGKIAFTGFLQENQQLQSNQTVCFINPENTQYYAEVYIPQSNFGKVKQGQKVLLKLPAYPYPEFGAVIGKLDFISSMGTDTGYLAKVLLPKGLQTDYNKQVQYHEGLSAQAEIITEDMKLSDRLLNQVRSAVKNN